MTNNNAGLKKLAQANGLLGVIGGPISLICTCILTISLFTDPHSFAQSGVALLSVPVYIIRIAALVMGIIGLVKFKGTNYVPLVAHIFFVIGLPVGFVIGILADIFIIIAGIIYLTSLKKFDQPQTPQMPNQNFQ